MLPEGRVSRRAAPPGRLAGERHDAGVAHEEGRAVTAFHGGRMAQLARSGKPGHPALRAAVALFPALEEDAAPFLVVTEAAFWQAQTDAAGAPAVLAEVADLLRGAGEDVQTQAAM